MIRKITYAIFLGIIVTALVLFFAAFPFGKKQDDSWEVLFEQ